MLRRGARRYVDDPALGRCLVLGPLRTNIVAIAFGTGCLVLLWPVVLRPSVILENALLLGVFGLLSAWAIARPLIESRTTRLWIGEHGFRHEAFRTPPVQALWRDTGPARKVLRLVQMPMRRDGRWGMFTATDLEVGARELEDLLNTARVAAVGDEPVPGAPWEASGATVSIRRPPPGRSTVRDFVADGDVRPTVDAWARANGFAFIGTDADGAAFFVASSLGYPSAALPDAQVVPARRFVLVVQSGRLVHLEAWWTRNSAFRLVTRGRTPLESPVMAGSGLGRLIFREVRLPVEDLLARLGQPPLAP
jgi:hypothetical protein